MPDESEIRALQQEMREVKNQYLKEKFDEVKSSISRKTLRVVDLATQKGASSWLSVLPLTQYFNRIGLYQRWTLI